MTTGCRDDRGCAPARSWLYVHGDVDEGFVHTHTIRKQLGPDA